MTSERKLEDRVGEILKSVRFPVEAGKIGEFARAMRDPSPIFQSQDAALANGFAAVPAPLTFSVASAHYSGGNATDLPLKLGLDLSRTVHGEQRWVYHRAVVAGEVLTGVTKVAQVDRKAGRNGEMVRVLTETQYMDSEEKLVISVSMLTIELPGR